MRPPVATTRFNVIIIIIICTYFLFFLQSHAHGLHRGILLPWQQQAKLQLNLNLWLSVCFSPLPVSDWLFLFSNCGCSHFPPFHQATLSVMCSLSAQTLNQLLILVSLCVSDLTCTYSPSFTSQTLTAALQAGEHRMIVHRGTANKVLTVTNPLSLYFSAELYFCELILNIYM